MSDVYGLAEHTGLILAVASAAIGALWLIMFRLRGADLKRIDIHREALDRIESKIDGFAEQLGTVIGQSAAYGPRLDRLDAACEWAKSAFVELAANAAEAKLLAAKVDVRVTSEFSAIEKRLDEHLQQSRDKITRLEHIENTLLDHSSSMSEIKRSLNGAMNVAIDKAVGAALERHKSFIQAERTKAKKPKPRGRR